MIMPIDSSVFTLDESIAELAELIDHAREGEISQALFRMSEYTGKDSEWVPLTEQLDEIRDAFDKLLAPIATQSEIFEVTVLHVRRATFVIELVSKAGKKANKPGNGKNLKPV